MNTEVLAQGYAIVPAVIDRAALAAIVRRLDATPVGGAGRRGLLRDAWCRTLAARLRSILTARQFLPEGFVAAQCTLFDKGPDRNWGVALHQDRFIPVRGKVDAPDLSGWSRKQGELFVQAPVAVLEQLTAVRLHIDHCLAESGALRVVPGSHRNGILGQVEVEALRARQGEVPVPACEADALLMKPLILHASSRATSGARRRVLHFVYGPRALPFGLHWRHAS